jgi:hypothetical protein
MPIEGAVLFEIHKLCATFSASVNIHSPKALNYRIFKENFELENCFRILEDEDMYTLCKFKITNHKLSTYKVRNEIEAKRNETKRKRNERKRNENNKHR